MSFSALDSELVGPLFATGAMRAVFSDQARLAAMLRAEAALARAEARCGLAPEALAAAIAAIPAEDLDLAALGQGTGLAGVPTIPFVKAVQARLPKELERSFHKGATTQDIVDTALVLQMRDALALIVDDLTAVVAALATLARRHRATPCVGRTYGQHAAPVTFGYKAAVWCMGVAEVADQLPWLKSRALVAALAGPVGTLAGLGDQGPAVADAFAEELGLGTTPIAWHARRARMAEAGAWLAILIGALAKMADDVAHLASTEVGEVAEPYVQGRGGSSAMPHKRNPVSSTVILAAQAAAPGHVVTLLNAMAAAHERPAGFGTPSGMLCRSSLGWPPARCTRRERWRRGSRSTPIGCGPTLTPPAAFSSPTPSRRAWRRSWGARRGMPLSNTPPRRCAPPAHPCARCWRTILLSRRRART